MDSGSGDMSVQVKEEEEDGGKKKQPRFQLDMGLIPSAELTDDAQQLRDLGLGVFNQDDFEQGVMEQVDQAITKEEEEKKKASLRVEMKKINDDIRALKHEIASITTQLAQMGRGFATGANRRQASAQKQKENKVLDMKKLEERKKIIQAKLEGKLPLFDESEKALKTMLGSSGNEERDKLIKTGEMTPFGTVAKKEPSEEASSSRQNIFDAKDKRHYQNHTEGAMEFRTSAPGPIKIEHHFSEDPELSDHEVHSDGEEWVPDDQGDRSSDHDYMSDVDNTGQDTGAGDDSKKATLKRKRKKWSRVHNRPIYQSNSEDSEDEKEKVVRMKAIRKHRDDGLQDYYDERMQNFHREERYKQKMREAGKMSDSDDDTEFDGGLKVPGRIWSKLYKYQKTCVKWLWELHCQEAGGIVGDEMGLGKTIQAIAFLAALKYSKLKNKGFSYVGLGPSLIVCPATVMHQWVKEFHTWWPPFRVAILHSSGTHVGKEKELVRTIVKHNGILVTSYTTLVLQQEHIVPYNWHYIVLDEGHKIRNPDTQATLVCKQFRTSHRIILSGSPIQNNLKELWSLMDFVFPGKLGTLPDFMQHFAVPIVQGGYSNASDIQVQTAYKCACVLRDTINPYLLRRMKADVKMNINLPGKNEQVLFCRLTEEQRDVYKEYLASRECQEILSGRFMVFAGLIQLRKICNHPDLATGGPRVFEGDTTRDDPSLEYGWWKRSGKMIVVDALLKLWKKQGNRALIFTQSRQMLDIMESYVQQKGYSYVRMDGGTGISSRQPLVQRYNQDDSIYLFLLTTRVGGLGVNLIGANRIIIYDPDWNPSTDMQARERAWRIGQKRQVTIYRLLTTATIEEKIYHRQIFKQFLTNRVLKDPKQRRLFKTNDMYELFSLGLSDDKGETETAALFAGTGTDVTVKPVKGNKFDRLKAEQKEEEKRRAKEEEEERANEDEEVYDLDSSEVKRMRELARKLSQKMEQSKLTKTDKSQDSESVPIKQGGSSSSKIYSEKIAVPGSLKNYKIKKKQPSKESIKQDSGDTIKKEPTSSNSCLVSGSHSKNSVTASVSGVKDSSVAASVTRRVSADGRRSSGTSDEKSDKHGKRDEDRKHKHKKKKHKKDAKFEGERIPHLSKVRKYKSGKSEEEENGSPKANQGQEDSDQMDNYVLHRLFKKTGIQGALRHDKIMEPGQSDYVIVEAEAEKVAREASQALKRSRSQCLPAIAGVPTWTGQHGSMSKRPRFGQKKNSILGKTEKEKEETKESKEKHFDGSLAGSVQTNIETGANVSSAISSTDLLNKMRVRNEVFTKPSNAENGEDDDDTDGFLSDPSSLELLKRIQEFVMFECIKIGQATTQEILDEFGSKLPSENSAKFRAMLRSICDFERIDDIGTWKLRRDFR